MFKRSSLGCVVQTTLTPSTLKPEDSCTQSLQPSMVLLGVELSLSCTYKFIQLRGLRCSIRVDLNS